MGGEHPEPQELPDEEFERIDPSDMFSPPTESCECYCLHCGRTFMSDGIWLQHVRSGGRDFNGFWMCPTPNCGGRGFTFDIFPTDPAHPANADWCDDDGESVDEVDDPPEDAHEAGLAPGWEDDEDYDPAEPGYREMDDELAAEGDIEGDEWKYGVRPDQEYTPPAPLLPGQDPDISPYDQPDQRPREIEWPDQPDNDSPVDEDELPF